MSMRASKPNERITYWAVEMNDPHPTLGGKTIKFPFAYQEHARVWAEDEITAAKELGFVGLTYRIFQATSKGATK